MQGYDVVTNDDNKVGHVVDVRGDYVIFEHGAIFKSKHALPHQLTQVDDSERVVRVTVSKEILEDSPKLDDGEVDEQAIAAYYGLAEGYGAPETAGFGDLTPDDPALSAEVQGRQADVEAAPEERARVRESMRPEGQDPTAGTAGRQIHGDRWETKE
jgi:hypothetical protein